MISKMFAVTVILSLAAGVTAESWLSKPSAASDAQIRFAIENKYDSTGPGAKSREYAYKTYQTLDEALVAYANDPDTQLPDEDKQRALHKLTRLNYNTISHVTPVPRYQPKTVDEYTGYKPKQITNQINPVLYEGYEPQIIQQNDIASDYTGWKPFSTGHPKKINEFRHYNPQTIISKSPYPKQQNSYGFESLNNGNSVNQEHYTQSDDFDPNPQYSFSYGVHDKGTGDSKSAHETRDGGTVRGYYTFMDADGKQRTVHYTADDKLGFRASVQRTHTNTQ